MVDFDLLSKHLDISDIDFRIQSINKGGYATILAYKDARVDINRLNIACTQLGWERIHSNNNHNCTVSIWDDANKHWVSKEDTGKESNTEAAKGLASDSFKRACTNWGIGIELYSYPSIQIKLEKNEFELRVNQTPKQTWNLKLKSWSWYAEFKDNRISFLAAQDQNKKTRFQWGNRNTNTNTES